MLQLSTAAILEKNKIAQDGVWLTLLELQAPDGVIIRLCHNNENVIWNSHEWIAFPFLIDTVKQSKQEMPKIPVKISNVTRAIERYVEQYNGFTDCVAIIRVVNSKYLADNIPSVEETFIVQHVTTDAEWATFDLGGALPIKMRFPFRRILKDWCPFVYKGIECAATASQTTCPGTLQGCRDRGNSVRFGGEPSMTGGLFVSNV